MPKFDYRIVVRSTLGDLEKQVRFMESQGWSIQEQANDITISAALNVISANGKVTVSMRREIIESEAQQ